MPPTAWAPCATRPATPWGLCPPPLFTANWAEVSLGASYPTADETVTVTHAWNQEGGGFVFRPIAEASRPARTLLSKDRVLIYEMP